MRIRYEDEPASPGQTSTTWNAVGAMFVAVYGDLKPHPWLHDLPYVPDAYDLFHQRSLAMGWLDDRSAGGDGRELASRASGLWAMNDAGWELDEPATVRRVASWFQVEVAPLPADRPLPVQPFLCCAQEATKRVGSLDLQGVRLILPVNGMDVSERPVHTQIPSLMTQGWENVVDPTEAASIDVTVSFSHSAGQVEGLLRRVEAVSGGLFRIGELVRGVNDRQDGDDAARSESVTAWIPDWSVDSIGWVAGLTAECAAASGPSDRLTLTVFRHPSTLTVG